MCGLHDKNPGKTCKINGCDGPVFGRGWCNKHYQRWKNNGDPLLAKRRFRQALTCEFLACGKPGYLPRRHRLREMRSWLAL